MPVCFYLALLFLERIRAWVRVRIRVRISVRVMIRVRVMVRLVSGLWLGFRYILELGLPHPSSAAGKLSSPVAFIG